MQLVNLLRTVYRKVNGEMDDTISSSSADGATILDIANEMAAKYYAQTDEYGKRVVWQHSIDPEYAVDIVNSYTTYPFSRDFLSPAFSGFRQGVSVGGAVFKPVHYQELYDPSHANDNVCAITREGITFRSYDDISDYVGQEIRMPAVIGPKTLANDTDDVSKVTNIPDKDLPWLVEACAAEYTRTDIIRSGQYGNLLSNANDIMRGMIQQNELVLGDVYWREK